MFLPIEPNWDAPVTETIVFRTGIFTTRAGKESRKSFRSKPRRSIGFSALMDGLPRSKFEQVLVARGASLLAIEDFLITGVTGFIKDQSKVEIAGSDATSWLTTGSSVFLKGLSGSEFVNIQDRVVAADGKITLSLDRSVSMQLGTKVTILPVVWGRLPQTQGQTQVTDDVSTISIQFDVTPGTSVESSEHQFESFAGLPVLSTEPNWRGSPSFVFETPFETVDYGRGVTKAYSPIEFSNSEMQFQFSGNSFDILQGIRSLFIDCLGRAKEFYMPTWVNDIEPTTGISSIGRSFYAKCLSGFHDSTVNKAIVIRDRFGNDHYSKVASIEPARVQSGPFSGKFGSGFQQNSNEQNDTSSTFGTGFNLAFRKTPVGEDLAKVTLETLPDFGLATEDIVRISWLHRTRFAADTLVTNWITDSVAQVQITVKSLEHLEVSS